MNAIQAIYIDKPNAYFAGARDDIVEMMNTDGSSAVLELGCGSGATGLATLAAGKAGRYIGIELDPRAAQLARSGLSRVLTGDVADMDLSALHGSCDALIISEVMEHLVDPWAVLAKLVACLKPGGRVYASSPNAAHWHVIAGLLRGRFDYATMGVMDRTHLRWFTPATFRALFEGAGVDVQSVEPSEPLRSKARLFDALTGGRFRHLLHTQMMLRGAKAA
jgi:SAM-dependent methyltransferase